MQRYFAILCAVFALTACATAPLAPEVQARLNQVASTAQPTSTASGTFTVVDQRDPDSLRVRYAPTGIAGGFSCNAGVEQLGAERHAPDRINRLQAALSQAYPSTPVGSELIVRRYDIFLNHTAETNAEAVGAGFGGGLIAEAIAPTPDSQGPRITRVARCNRERMQYGWFDPSDLENNFPPVTIDIDVTVFGRPYLINTAYSPQADFYRLGFTFGLDGFYVEAQGAMVATLQQAMAKAEARLIESIAAANPPAGESGRMESVTPTP